MTYDEIKEKLRTMLKADSYEENARLLRSEGEKLAASGNADGVKAVSDLLLEIMPEEQRIEVERLTHLDGEALDQIYLKIVKMINDGKAVEAEPLAEKLYYKITEEYRGGEDYIFLSLRNPFEDTLYHNLFKPKKTIRRAPFDFAAYLTAYAYIILDTGSPLDAIPILEKAEEFNPVDVGPKFELAEVYKLLKNKKKLIEITRNTLKVASSPMAIARCHANMGYICVDFGEFDDAVAFYTASVMFAPNPAIPYELSGIAQRKGTPIQKPSVEQIKKVFEKYGLEFGVDKDVIGSAAQLSTHYIIKNDIPNALKALKLLYGITLDEKIKELIHRYEPPVSDSGKKPDIKRTVNNENKD